MRIWTIFCLLCWATPSIGQEQYWQDIPFRDNASKSLSSARALLIDRTLLSDLLSTPTPDRVMEISVPFPDGSRQRFQITRATTMSIELAEKFPEIVAWQGGGLDDLAATIHLDFTPNGFHAMILRSGGSIFIDPASPGSSEHFSYFKHDYRRDAGQIFQCDTTAHFDTSAVNGTPSGGELRSYRLAVAATGEYTQFHGGSVALALAEIVTAMNRVNGVYQRDLAITMQLVADNDQVIYTDASTDPYTNNNGFSMLGQNQTNLDNVIGDANYDIGHVFSTGGGGIASLGVPCRSGFKARGVTGLGNPSGDPFYIDYVAHEMGHQWGGNHTFNGNAGSCSGGNRNASTAYEPGSGSTIQAYAGICSPQNLQSNSDAYFHTISFDEMYGYASNGFGNTCAAISASGNAPPTVEAGGAYTIPANTPFMLCGVGDDIDGDTLSYNWEQFDTGPTGHPDSPSGNAPIFRSFSPGANACRTFPQNSDLLTGNHTLGELLPDYARVLNFRLTVRDNHPGSGGSAYDATSVIVDENTGPFQVTMPTGAGIVWAAGELQDITWDVAGTDSGTVACADVDILLSENGGDSFDTLVLGMTANDGAQTITVPAIGGDQIRIAVACSNNIFFNVNDADLSITAETVFGDGFESIARNNLLRRQESVRE